MFKEVLVKYNTWLYITCGSSRGDELALVLWYVDKDDVSDIMLSQGYEALLRPYFVSGNTLRVQYLTLCHGCLLVEQTGSIPVRGTLGLGPRGAEVGSVMIIHNSENPLPTIGSVPPSVFSVPNQRAIPIPWPWWP